MPLASGSIVCAFAPPSLQECEHEARCRWLSPCGLGTSSVCATSAVVCRTYGVARVTPSTTTWRPAGLVWKVSVMAMGTKFAAWVMGPFMVIVAGLFGPVYEPEPVPTQPAKS